jgi:manganese transport protein
VTAVLSIPIPVSVPVPARSTTGTPLGSGRGSRSRWPRLVGPALLVSAGYVDPGNWGTDVAAGHLYGYRLIWVLAAAIVAALFLQQLAARVGFATGQDLATLIRRHVRASRRRVLMPPLLVALAITETIELLGVVFGVRMLTGWPLVPAVGFSAGLVLAVLAAPGATGRRVVYGCLGLIGVIYIVALSGHGAVAVLMHVRPSGLPTGSAPVAVGLIGSIVMPHNILLQSALARDEAAIHPWTPGSSPLRGSLVTTALALTLAFVVNAAITSLAIRPGHGTHAGLAVLPAGLGSTFGPFATVLFGLTLLASGLASSTTGAMISLDVLQQLVPSWPLPALARRALFLLPATAIAASPLPPVSVLVFSQMVLTWSLPVVLVPLICFAARADLMGPQVLSRRHVIVAALVTGGLMAAGFASFAPW